MHELDVFDVSLCLGDLHFLRCDDASKLFGLSIASIMFVLGSELYSVLSHFLLRELLAEVVFVHQLRVAHFQIVVFELETIVQCFQFGG